MLISSSCLGTLFLRKTSPCVRTSARRRSSLLPLVRALSCLSSLPRLQRPLLSLRSRLRRLPLSLWSSPRRLPPRRPRRRLRLFLHVLRLPQPRTSPPRTQLRPRRLPRARSSRPSRLRPSRRLALRPRRRSLLLALPFRLFPSFLFCLRSLPRRPNLLFQLRSVLRLPLLRPRPSRLRLLLRRSMAVLPPKRRLTRPRRLLPSPLRLLSLSRHLPQQSPSCGLACSPSPAPAPAQPRLRFALMATLTARASPLVRVPSPRPMPTPWLRLFSATSPARLRSCTFWSPGAWSTQGICATWTRWVDRDELQKSFTDND